ncbi:hypothetical protein VTO42DRAFT_1094 [Malbranchea cinnamomea]
MHAGYCDTPGFAQADDAVCPFYNWGSVAEALIRSGVLDKRYLSSTETGMDGLDSQDSPSAAGAALRCSNAVPGWRLRART